MNSSLFLSLPYYSPVKSRVFWSISWDSMINLVKSLDSCPSSPQLCRPIPDSWCCTSCTSGPPFTSPSTSHGPNGMLKNNFKIQNGQYPQSFLYLHEVKSLTNLEDCRAAWRGRGKKQKSKSATRTTFVSEIWCLDILHKSPGKWRCLALFRCLTIQAPVRVFTWLNASHTASYRCYPISLLCRQFHLLLGTPVADFSLMTQVQN